jgi:hypothetical protein
MLGWGLNHHIDRLRGFGIEHGKDSRSRLVANKSRPLLLKIPDRPQIVLAPFQAPGPHGES